MANNPPEPLSATEAGAGCGPVGPDPAQANGDASAASASAGFIYFTYLRKNPADQSNPSNECRINTGTPFVEAQPQPAVLDLPNRLQPVGCAVPNGGPLRESTQSLPITGRSPERLPRHGVMFPPNAGSEGLAQPLSKPANGGAVKPVAKGSEIIPSASRNPTLPTSAVPLPVVRVSVIALRAHKLLAVVQEAPIKWQADRSWLRIYEAVSSLRSDMLWLNDHAHHQGITLHNNGADMSAPSSSASEVETDVTEALLNLRKRRKKAVRGNADICHIKSPGVGAVCLW